MSLVRLIARPMLATIFVVQGADALRNPDRLAPTAARFADRVVPAVKQVVPKEVADRIPEDPRMLVRINGAIQLLAGAALATGRVPRVSALALVASLIPTTLSTHSFWEMDDPADKSAQRIQFMKNLGLTGGLLLAAVDTEGQPGLWWRTRHGATAAKKATKRAAHEARREAKLAAKVVRARIPGAD